MYLMGYNFMSDNSVLDPAPTILSSVNGAQLSNAIFDHFNVLNSGDAIYDETIPSTWTSSTILDADFDGNVNAGNISYSTQDLAGIKIKRRIKGTFSWLTLYDMPVTDPEELNFVKYDILNQHGVTYEYAIVPYLNNNTECAYIIQEVDSYFNGIFLCSPDSLVKFYAGASYGTGSVANNTGLFEPLGSKYPIVVSNANTQYYGGTFSATAMSYMQLMSNAVSRVNTSAYLHTMANYVADKTVKVLKDWNGNIWLIAILDKAKITYNNNIGMGIGNVSFDFVEIGSAYDQKALLNNGFVNLPFTPVSNGFPAHNPQNNPMIDIGAPVSIPSEQITPTPADYNPTVDPWII